MEKYAAHKLDSEGPLAQHSVRRLSYKGVCLGKNIFKLLAIFKPCAELVRHFSHFAVAHCLIFVGKSFYFIYRGNYFFYLMVAVSSEYLRNYAHCVRPPQIIFF